MLWLLLLFSGVPLIYKQSWGKFVIALIALFLAAVLFRDLKVRVFRTQLLIYVSVFLFIFIFQYFNIDSFSLPFIIVFVSKIFIGAIIFFHLKDQFRNVFFNTIFLICLISLLFYFLQYIGGATIERQIHAITETNSIGLYTFRPLSPGETFLRNSGMFWEPGAFQGYINLCIFLNIDRLGYLWKTNRFKSLIILLSLISTQSTTAYIVLFSIILVRLFIKNKRNVLILFFSLFVLLFIGKLLYNNVSFMKEKIQRQFENATYTDKDFTNDRFGSFLFDLYYIEKHPITGNGFHEKRYIDHPWVYEAIKNGENLGFSNGFSSFTASMGILGMMWYFVFFFYNRTGSNKEYILGLCIVVFLLLQGEPFLNFPFFLALPFMWFNVERRL